MNPIFTCKFLFNIQHFQDKFELWLRERFTLAFLTTDAGGEALSRLPTELIRVKVPLFNDFVFCIKLIVSTTVSTALSFPIFDVFLVFLISGSCDTTDAPGRYDSENCGCHNSYKWWIRSRLDVFIVRMLRFSKFRVMSLFQNVFYKNCTFPGYVSIAVQCQVNFDWIKKTILQIKPNLSFQLLVVRIVNHKLQFHLSLLSYELPEILYFINV